MQIDVFNGEARLDTINNMACKIYLPYLNIIFYRPEAIYYRKSSKLKLTKNFVLIL